MADDEREEQEVGPATRMGAEQAAALDRVTDRVSPISKRVPPPPTINSDFYLQPYSELLLCPPLAQAEEREMKAADTSKVQAAMAALVEWQ